MRDALTVQNPPSSSRFPPISLPPIDLRNPSHHQHSSTRPLHPLNVTNVLRPSLLPSLRAGSVASRSCFRLSLPLSILMTVTRRHLFSLERPKEWSRSASGESFEATLDTSTRRDRKRSSSPSPSAFPLQFFVRTSSTSGPSPT